MSRVSNAGRRTTFAVVIRKRQGMTPLRFASEPSVKVDWNDAKLYVYTIGVSGKVKRIRNDAGTSLPPTWAEDCQGE